MNTYTFIQDTDSLKGNGLSGENTIDRLLNKEVEYFLYKWKDVIEGSQVITWDKRLKAYGMSNDELKEVIKENLMPIDFGNLLIAPSLKSKVKEIKKSELDCYLQKDSQNFFPALHTYNLLTKEKVFQKINNSRNLEPALNKIFNNLNSLIEEICNEFIIKTKPFLYPLLIEEFNLSQKFYSNDKIENGLRFSYFMCNTTNSEEWIDYLFKKYPALDTILYNLQDYWVSSIILFLERISSDYLEIVSHFNIPNASKVIKIGLFLGDSHNGGHTTNFIEFEYNKKIYYKPRALKSEVLFKEFYQSLLSHGWSPSMRMYYILDKIEYGWVENVEHLSCDNISQINKFYHKQGMNLALSYVLGITDLIYDNIIARGDLPAFIDLECILYPHYPYTKEDYYSSSAAGRYFSTSVYGTNLLPYYSPGTVEREGLNMGGLASLIGQVDNLASEIRFSPDGALKKTINKLRINSLNEKNMPKYGDKIFYVGEYIDDVLKGFKEGYLFIQKHKQFFYEGIKTFKGIKVRYLLRPTASYRTILKESFHSDYYRNNIDRDILFEYLWGAYNSTTMPEKAIQSEIGQLKDGDIPYFHTYSDSRHLWSVDGELLYEDYFPLSGIDLAIQKINRLSDEDFSIQKRIIINSFLAHIEEYDPNNKVTKPQQFSIIEKGIKPFDIKLDKKLVLDEVTRIGDYIYDLSFKENGEFSLMDLTVNKHQMLSQGVKHKGLFDGTDGIAIFFSYLYKYTGNENYKNIATYFTKQSMKEFMDSKVRYLIKHGIISLFAYPNSAFYAAEHLSYALNENIIEEDSLNELYNWIAYQLPSDKYYDFLIGSAGTIPFMLYYYQKSKNEKYLDLAIRCGHHLVDNAKKMKNGVAWDPEKFKYFGGFSHGTAYISYILFRLNKFAPDERFNDCAIQSLIYDQSLFEPETQRWIINDALKDTPPNNYWAYGSGGIALSRILVSEFYQNKFLLEEIEIAKCNLLNYGFGKNHSLANGTFGNLEILYSIAKYQKDETLKKNLNAYVNQILCSKSIDEPWLCAKGNSTAVLTGTFYGLSGIGYNLLKFLDWENVPSILQANFPPLIS